MTRYFRFFYLSLLFASCSGPIEKQGTPFTAPAFSETPVILSGSTPTPTERVLTTALPENATSTPFKDLLEISFDVTPTQLPTSQLALIAPDNAGDIELLTILGGGRVYDLAWSLDSQFLAAGTSTGLKLYAARSPGAPPLQISPLTQKIMKVAFSPVSAIVAAEVWQDSVGRTIQVWDVEKRELVRDDDLPFDQVFDLEFHPKGDLLAISGGSEGILLKESPPKTNNLFSGTAWINWRKKCDVLNGSMLQAQHRST